LELQQLAVNTIKGLAMDAVQAANSGHPGMPMGAANMGTVLWTQFLKFDPKAPEWPDRDRFVLSAGHGSMLIYSLLHLSGYELSLDDLKNFRQWGSKTPGHPEFGHTVGVETTTGPLGAGLSNAVGLAMAERYLADKFGADLVDHNTWAVVGDGCLMEGVASEAASLAGHLKLRKLNVLYDDNQITIDGGTDISFSEDVAKRFEAYGWHTVRCNGHDPADVARACAEALASDKPSLILARTVIGESSAKEGTSSVHGAPLGPDEVRATKARLGMDPDVDFAVADGVYDFFQQHDGPARRAEWESRLAAHPMRDEFLSWMRLSADKLEDQIPWPSFESGSKLATRKASQKVLTAMMDATGRIVGGSADLAGSNGVKTGHKAMSPDSFADAPLIHFGVREHAMGGICNGLALHGGLLPFAATFLVFHDYMRPAVRLSALMQQQVVYVYTHDSIFLGEDGPTHQPIETLLAMRAVPGVKVIRPADASETTEAWKAALRYTDGPTCIVLTRQGLPTLDRTAFPTADGLHRGGYVLRHGDDVTLVATGSEVPLALDAADALDAQGIQARVVSMPDREAFLAQDASYKASVLGTAPRVSIEAGVTLGWGSIVGLEGASIGIDHFGASAPASVLAEKFGFTVDNVVATVHRVLGR